MEPNEIERRAMNGWDLPEDASLPERCYYWTMWGLWQQYRAGDISRDTAAKEKRKALRLFRESDALQKNCLAAYERQQSNIRCIGTLRTELIRAGTAEDKLSIALRMLSLMTGEDVTEKMVRGKMEEQA